MDQKQYYNPTEFSKILKLNFFCLLGKVAAPPSRVKTLVIFAFQTNLKNCCQSYTFEHRVTTVGDQWDKHVGCVSNLALFYMPILNQFDILSISIFCKIALSISISISIFSKITISISILIFLELPYRYRYRYR